MNCVFLVFMAILPALLPTAVAGDPGAGNEVLYWFFDDFEDNDISDWEECCAYGSWSASYGCVRGNTPTTPACLAAPSVPILDCVVRSEAKGVHVFGVLARLDDSENGIIAFVSPDHDVARIRLVEGGEPGTILASITEEFPSGVWYDLTFTCSGNQLVFCIEVPSTGDSWQFDAVDPDPHEGLQGLLMADESNAYWEWFEVSSSGGSTPGMITAMAVEDDNSGESDGDDDGAFEADEEIELDLELTNDGSEQLDNVFAVLQSLDPDIQVTDDYEIYGDIPPGGSLTCDDDFGLYAGPAVPGGVCYPLRLSVFADGGYFTQVDFEIPLGCGMTCDVESGFDPWSFYSILSGWGNNWHVSSGRNHTPGGSSSFKCGDTGSGDYDNEIYCAAVSPFFNVPKDATLTFWMWIDAQVLLSNDDIALDGGLFQIGQCGTWQDLAPGAGYPYQIVSGTTGPFDPGTGVYSGTWGWQHVTLALPDELAGPRRLRYVFGSDEAGTREGWYIDDVCVEGATGIGDTQSGRLQQPLAVSAYPQPFSGGTTFVLTGALAGSAEIRVFDLSGRLVRSLVVDQASTGQTELQLYWDGSDQAGVQIPPGVYFAACTSGSEDDLLRLVRIP